MTFQEIFNRYAKDCIPWDSYPEELFDAIQASPQEAADYALAYLDNALQDPDVTSREDDAYQELMCALAIVTGLMDKRAFPLVLRFAEAEIANELMGDYVTELYSDMIARTFDGDIDALVRTITAEDTDEFAAEAILLAMGVMRREDMLSNKDYETFIAKIFSAKIDNDVIMTGAVSSILESGAQNLAYRIDEVADRRLLLDYVVGSPEECKEALELEEFVHGFIDDDFREWMDEFF